MIIDSLVLKIATRCNIACRYCYWFRDPEVMNIPKRLTLEAERELLIKLNIHIRKYQLTQFSISLHGGEPLLFGKQRFAGLCGLLRQLELTTACKINLTMTSNGMLLDPEWIALLKRFNVQIAISVDGDEANHDANRVDFKGHGTYQQVASKIRLLQKNQIYPPVLMVANPRSNPHTAIRHLISSLGITYLNVLFPDLTHDDDIESIGDYYCDLFDLWFDQYIHQKIDIPILESLIKVSIGGRCGSQMVGLGKTSTVSMLTDGTLQATDDVRPAAGVMTAKINIVSNQIQDVIDDPLWRELYHFSDNLPQKCLSCQYKNACGGSTMVSRWSAKNRFDNPSVYCEDLQQIFSHVQRRLITYSPQLEGHILASQTA